LGTSGELKKKEPDIAPTDTIGAGPFNTLGNIDVGARYLIHQGSFLGSIQLMSGLKTASTGIPQGFDQVMMLGTSRLKFNSAKVGAKPTFRHR